MTREYIEVDVPELFQGIRAALSDTTNAVYVRFDPTRGFPKYLEIGDRWVTDVGYIRKVERFEAIPEDRAQCAAI